MLRSPHIRSDSFFIAFERDGGRTSWIVLTWKAPMISTQRYWQLVRLHSAGGYQIETICKVKHWFQEKFSHLLEDKTLNDEKIQFNLFKIWQQNEQDSTLAELSLRCFISYQIWQSCSSLVRQFGDVYQLRPDELLSLVLDDVGQRSDGITMTRHQPFSLEILNSYVPGKGKLSTWASRLTKNQTSINRYLLDHGLYRASDWAILNDTSCDQLRRILSNYFGYKPATVELACQLLERYHSVYRQERQQFRQSRVRTLCLPPTDQQLQQIAQDPTKETLKRLLNLASQLRQYRIHVRRGTPFTIRTSDLGNDFNIDNLSDPTNVNQIEWEDEQHEFLRIYRRDLNQCLQQAIESCIHRRISRLQKRQPDDSTVYVKAMMLFHCEGLPMGKIAPHVDRQTQVQVTRLLQLTQLRNNVRSQVVPRMQAILKQQCLQYMSIERFSQVSEQLYRCLEDEVEHILEAYKREIQHCQGCRNSLFSRHIREVMNHWQNARQIAC
jgi:hypothetical protein